MSTHQSKRIILCAALIGACHGRSGRECRQLHETLFRSPVDSQIAQFRRLSPHEQYIAFMCGNRDMEPPQLALIDPYAQTGRAALDELRNGLRSEREGMGTTAIISVLYEMERLGTYDVRHDTTLGEEVRRAIARTENPEWRCIANEKWSAIIKGETRLPSDSTRIRKPACSSDQPRAERG